MFWKWKEAKMECSYLQIVRKLAFGEREENKHEGKN